MNAGFSYECISFLQAAATGAISAAVYIFLRSVRRTGGKALAAVCDALFWAVFLTVWSFMTFVFTKGLFRAYELLGLILGGFICFSVFGATLNVIFDKIIKIFSLILKYLLTAGRFLYKMIVSVFSRIFKRKD